MAGFALCFERNVYTAFRLNIFCVLTDLLTKNKMPLRLHFVGRTGFEPATPWSQTTYSTGLNYLPKHLLRAILASGAGFSQHQRNGIAFYKCGGKNTDLGITAQIQLAGRGKMACSANRVGVNDLQFGNWYFTLIFAVR